MIYECYSNTLSPEYNILSPSEKFPLHANITKSTTV